MKRITVLAGAGVRIDLGGIKGELFAEQFRFRLTPSRLFGADTTTPVLGTRSPVQHNWTYGAALSIPLSTVSNQERGVGLQGTRAPLEPFVGRLKFDGDLNLRDQDLVGIRTGIDFGPLFGVRGFYWRGINEDHDDTDPISGYGGEAQFNLNEGRGLAPFVVLGAGRIDFQEKFRDPAGNTREDETALILGGGVSFTLTDRMRLNVAVRDFVTTNSESLTDAREPDDLLHSRLLSAGLTFSLGGSSKSTAKSPPAPARDMKPDSRESRAPTPQADARTAPRVMSAEEMKDSSAVQREISRLRAENAALRRGDSNKLDAQVIEMERTGGRQPIIVPAPTAGEIVIRYGHPSDASMHARMPMTRGDTTRRVVMIDTVVIDRGAPRAPAQSRDTVREAAPSAETAAMEARLRELEQELQSQRRELERTRAVAREAGRDAEVAVDRSSKVSSSRGRSFVSRLGGVRPADITPFVGFNGGDGLQFVVSARADLGPVSDDSRFDLVPDLSIATGSDRTTVLALANLRYTLGEVGRVQPYLMGGAGFFTRSFVAVGTSVGASVNMRSAGRSPLYGFGEVQGVNFFKYTRLLFGVSTNR
ncbi:MAG: hypothetical protein ABIZ91_09745 [Gemmatimonadaceae bacterium]